MIMLKPSQKTKIPQKIIQKWIPRITFMDHNVIPNGTLSEEIRYKKGPKMP
jgi:hypothetical protein